MIDIVIIMIIIFTCYVLNLLFCLPYKEICIYTTIPRKFETDNETRQL
eukprot:UN03017